MRSSSISWSRILEHTLIADECEIILNLEALIFDLHGVLSGVYSMPHGDTQCANTHLVSRSHAICIKSHSFARRDGMKIF